MKIKKQLLIIILGVLLLAPGVAYGQFQTGLDMIEKNVTNTSTSKVKKITLTGDITVTLGGLVKGATGFVGVICLVIVVYAGILWMTAQGNDEQVNKAKTMIMNGVIGIVITLSAYMITTLVTSKVSNAVSGYCCQENGGEGRCHSYDVETKEADAKAACAITGKKDWLFSAGKCPSSCNVSN